MTILYVVPKANMIAETQARLGDHFKVISMGTKIAGEGFDQIWIDEDYKVVYKDEPFLLGKCCEAVREVSVRLYPRGRMSYVS